jgi:hypothetical protein
MEAGSEQCKEPDDAKLLRVDCLLIEICRFDGKVGLFCRGERNGSRRTVECTAAIGARRKGGDDEVSR